MRDAVAGCDTAGATRGALGAGAVLGARVVVARFSACGFASALAAAAEQTAADSTSDPHGDLDRCHRCAAEELDHRRAVAPRAPWRGRGARASLGCTVSALAVACCFGAPAGTLWAAPTRPLARQVREHVVSGHRQTRLPLHHRRQKSERESADPSGRVPRTCANSLDFAGLRERNRSRYRPLAARRLPPFWTNICVSG